MTGIQAGHNAGFGDDEEVAIFEGIGCDRENGWHSGAVDDIAAGGVKTDDGAFVPDQEIASADADWHAGDFGRAPQAFAGCAFEA